MINSEELEQTNLQKKLEEEVGSRLRLKINNNRSTMLSVKWEPDATRVSLHRMFLQAPSDVVKQLSTYIKGSKRGLSPGIKTYIQESLQKFDYSYTLDLNKLDHQGQIYNLKKMYDELNHHYFNSQLPLLITWYGRKKKNNASRSTFGLYHDSLKLIKIHKIVDQEKFPEFFVSYIIYHEMLHYVCPSYVDKNGIKHMHGAEFKKKEREFSFYNDVRRWIKENQNILFSEYCE